MPATFAHPAAVLWFARGPLCLSALVIGSIAPDFDYVFESYLPRRAGHDLFGIFTFCLPFGLFAYAIFHGGLKRPLSELFPARMADRLRVTAKQPTSWHPIFVPLALIIGSATHVFFDDLTHGRGWAIALFPQLDWIVVSTTYRVVEMHRAFQYGLTLFGAGLLLREFRHYLGRAPTESGPARPILGLAIVLGSGQPDSPGGHFRRGSFTASPPRA